MPNPEQERADLAAAERHIAAGEQRVADQLRRIGELRQHGHDTAAAEALLNNLRSMLAQWYEHRAAILNALYKTTDSSA